MNNRIPRKFNCIIGKMLIETSCDKPNDIIHITKNEYNNYIALNTRTQKYSCCFIGMLRNAEIFELMEVEI